MAKGQKAWDRELTEFWREVDSVLVVKLLQVVRSVYKSGYPYKKNYSEMNIISDSFLSQILSQVLSFLL